MQTPPPGYQLNRNGGIYTPGAAHFVEVRVNFLNGWKQQSALVTELCKIHGISDATGYRWIEEYVSGNKIDALPHGQIAKVSLNQLAPRWLSRPYLLFPFSCVVGESDHSVLIEDKLWSSAHV